MVSGIIIHVALVFNICSEIKYHINQGIVGSIIIHLHSLLLGVHEITNTDCCIIIGSYSVLFLFYTFLVCFQGPAARAKNQPPDRPVSLYPEKQSFMVSSKHCIIQSGTSHL